jgi:hypothetical protein
MAPHESEQRLNPNLMTSASKATSEKREAMLRRRNERKKAMESKDDSTSTSPSVADNAPATPTKPKANSDNDDKDEVLEDASVAHPQINDFLVEEVTSSDEESQIKSPPKKYSKQHKTSIPKKPSETTKKRNQDGAQVTTISPPDQQQRMATLLKLKHHRVVITGGYNCSDLNAEVAIEEFADKFKQLVGKFKTLDPNVVVEPLDPNDTEYPAIKNVKDVPDDPEVLTFAYLAVESWQFNPKKSKKKGQEQTTLPGTPYFQMVISCNKDPERLIDSISLGWKTIGGAKLELSDIQSVGTVNFAQVFNVPPGISVAVMTDEVHFAMEHLHAEMVNEGVLPPDFLGQVTPVVSLGQSIPKVPGRKTKQPTYAQKKGSNDATAELSEYQLKLLKTTWHLEADKREYKLASAIIEYGTQTGFWLQYWGKFVKLSKPLGKNAQLLEKQNLVKLANQHLFYNGGMTLMAINGIIDLNAVVSYIAQDGSTKSLSLRNVLTLMVKTENDKLVFGSVHQGTGATSIEAVVPDLESTQRIAEMLSKNPAAYLRYYLVEKYQLPEDMVRKLVRKSIAPNLVAEIDACLWDGKNLVLTTPKEQNEDALNNNLEDMEWMHLLEEVTEKKVSHTPRAPGFVLDDDQSCKTVHQVNAARRKEAVTFEDIQNNIPKNAKGVVDLASDDRDSSTGRQPTVASTSMEPKITNTSTSLNKEEVQATEPVGEGLSGAMA